jgi:hypothetical protein
MKKWIEDIDRINVIGLEYTRWNGLNFYILEVERNLFEGSLLGLNLAPEFLYIEIFYFRIRVFDKNKYSKKEKG